MKTIVWDVDDVLNDLMRCWFEQAWLPEHPRTKLKYKEITENPPHQLLGIEKNEYLALLDAFRVSKEAQEMEPIAEVMDWFKNYGQDYFHIALTARPLLTIPVVAAWVFKHFGRWIRSFHFIPAERQNQNDGALRLSADEAGLPRLLPVEVPIPQNIPRYYQTKGECLERIGRVDFFVDDAPENIEEAVRLGIKTILFPRPWNGNKSNIEEALRELR